MSPDELSVRRFRRYIAGWLLLRQSVAAVTVWAFLWGTAVLALKVALPGSSFAVWLGVAGLPVALGAAAWAALRRVPDASAVRAVLDSRGERGGLLMAGAECALGDWEQNNAPPAEPPALRWEGRRPLALLAVAVTYVVLGFVVPARGLADPARPLDIDRPAERLAEQVRVLLEEKIIPPERAENLKEKIDELKSKSASKDPAKTLEALDHLNDVVKQAARQTAENGARQAQQSGQLEAAAAALQRAAPELSPQDAAELMKELAALAEQAAGNDPGLESQLGAELAQALKDGKLSSEQLKALAAAAKARKDAIAGNAKNLHNAKLIDTDQLKACEGGKCDADGLAKYLAKKEGNKSLKEGLKKQNGNGGIGDDGPGDTDLTFGDKASDAGVKFKEEALPPSELSALKDSQVFGVSKAPPMVDPKGAAPQAGGLKGATDGGGSANAVPVLPQHRGAVGRYFDRPEK